MSTKWTLVTLTEEAIKYATKTDFLNGSKKAYTYAYETGVIESICTHMEEATPAKHPRYSPEDFKDSNKLPMNIKGIYKLFNKNGLVYIGKSTSCVRRRFLKHIADKRGLTKVEVYEIHNTANIHIMEVYLITTESPPLNNDCKTTDSTTFNLPPLESITHKKYIIDMMEILKLRT